MKFGVRAKFIVVTTGILIFTIGIAAAISSHVFTEEYSKALQDKTFVVGENLRGQLNKLQNMGIPVQELVGFDKLCQDAVDQNGELAYAMVVDLDGRILFQNDTPENLRTVSDPATLQAVRSTRNTVQKYWESNEKFYDIFVPVFGRHGEHVATVRLGFPAKFVARRINRFVNYTILAFVISLAFAIILVIASSYIWISRPLGRLLAVIREIIKSGPGVKRRVEIHSRDEIGQLASAFNQMTAQLNESHEEITRYSEELELKVEERTARLAEINSRLQEDILERRRAEEALRESEKRYRELADLLPQPVYETDAKGNLVFVNRALTSCFGFSREDFAKGVNLLDVLLVKDRQRALEDLFSSMKMKKRIDREYTAIRREGSKFPLVISASPILRNDEVVGLRGIMLDLTEHKAAEEELVKMQRLESLGVLAGGIAHDFNNILGIILGNISLAELYLEPGSELNKLLTEAGGASLQARGLTQQLITFSTGGAPIKRTDSIKETLSEAVRFGLSGSKIKPVLRTAEDLWPVECDFGQIHQVIMNLIINAKEAMPDGGVIEVSATNKYLTAERNPFLKEGRYVILSIRDHGVGIPEEVLPKIFDPYFSTKQRGAKKGMGLGLTICYSVVKKHEGDILVESEKGRGTTFHVYLPASLAESPAAQLTEQAAPRFIGKGKVLVMDDEQMIRNMAIKMLTRLGYEVDVTKEGAEAVERYKQAAEQGSPFDVVIFDLTVPGAMGGVEAVKTLREQYPALRAVVTSGYSTDPVIADFTDYGFNAAIVKPFNLQKLGEVIQSVAQS